MELINEYIKDLKSSLKNEPKDSEMMLKARDVIKMLIEIKGEL